MLWIGPSVLTFYYKDFLFFFIFILVSIINTAQDDILGCFSFQFKHKGKTTTFWKYDFAVHVNVK